MKHHGPSVQYYLFRVNDVAQQVQRVLVARVSRAPTQHTGEIVARSQGYDGAGRGGTFAILAHVVQTLQYPTYRPVTAANQYLVVFYVTENVESAKDGKGE